MWKKPLYSLCAGNIKSVPYTLFKYRQTKTGPHWWMALIKQSSYFWCVTDSISIVAYGYHRINLSPINPAPRIVRMLHGFFKSKKKSLATQARRLPSRAARNGLWNYEIFTCTTKSLDCPCQAPTFLIPLISMESFHQTNELYVCQLLHIQGGFLGGTKKITALFISWDANESPSP